MNRTTPTGAVRLTQAEREAVDLARAIHFERTGIRVRLVDLTRPPVVQFVRSVLGAWPGDAADGEKA